MNPEFSSYPIEQIPSETLSTERRESRFKDKEAILEIMEHCDDRDIELLGNINEILPQTTPDHANIVELTRFKPSKNANQVVPAIIHHPGIEDIVCIFKPSDGESEESKEKFDLKQFYPQEAAAYIISEAFGFDLVPPTIIRTKDGRIGAFQLFMDHNEYATYGMLDLPDEAMQLISDSDDYKKLALLDFIIASCERHENNWLIKANLTEHGYQIGANSELLPQLVAIDHGISLSTTDYIKLAPRGPLHDLTYQEPPRYSKQQSGKAIEVPIPDNLMSLLNDGLAHRDSLNKKLIELQIPPKEISYMFQRTKALVEEGIFLSKRNRRMLPKNVLEEPSHPPFLSYL